MVKHQKISRYYENDYIFNGIYSWNNLSKIKNEAYIINLYEYKSVGTNWTVFYINNDNVTYCDSFLVEHIPKEIIKFIRNKYMTTNLFKTEEHDSIMYGHFCGGFIDVILKGKVF